VKASGPNLGVIGIGSGCYLPLYAAQLKQAPATLWEMSLSRRHFLFGAAALPLPSRSTKAVELSCDIAVIGAGVGGFAAALAALRAGQRVVLTEETDWIGGQLTSQAVPPDEHPWIEEFGCTRSYRAYRDGVREYYRSHYPLSETAREQRFLNPGSGTVSRLTHEPRVSLAVLQGMLAPYIGDGRLTLLLHHVPERATVSGDRMTSVTVRDQKQELSRTITASYFLDATELGDLLPMTGTECVAGAEPQAQTGEAHASSRAEPANNQAFTFCFALDYLAAEDHSIKRPASYATWRDYVPQLGPPWTGRLLSWAMCDPKTLKLRKAFFAPNPAESQQSGLNLWTYRRIADRTSFTSGFYRSDITLVNWPQNDYLGGDLLTTTFERRQAHLRAAKELSLSLLYWMQTEAPRPNGGYGWKGLRLRNDIVGSEDGLAKAPYIRESRRILAEFTVLEQHVGTDMRTRLTGKPREEVTAQVFDDTVGIGCYRIDLHPSSGGTNYIDISSLPFQIPLGALLPRRMENLLPACKNIGTTHVTNGCYRLHPVEWNIGEAAGALASYAIQIRQPPRSIRSRKALLNDFQVNLQAQGFELHWPKVHSV
jgi:hypothetical protein